MKGNEALGLIEMTWGQYLVAVVLLINNYGYCEIITVVLLINIYTVKLNPLLRDN